MYILKTGEFENIWWRIENRTNELWEKNKLDIYHVVNITRAFSHAQNNRMCGSNKTYFNLEKIVLQNLDKLSDRDATHLMYAYSVREAGNPELYAAFDKRLASSVATMDYPSLFNAIYYMLFRENKKPELWQNVIEATLNNDETLPIIYVRPFKCAKLYMEQHFPKWDLTEFQDKLFHAENYFTITRLDNNYEKDKEYVDFKVFLNGHCLVFPTQFISYHGLVQLHFVFKEYKIAINFHLNKYTRPFDYQPSQMQKLPATLLKQEGWEVYELTEKQFS
jgi:hypothetical protein